MHIEAQTPPEVLGEVAADLLAGQPYIHFQGLDLQAWDPSERDTYIRTSSQALGELTLSNGQPGSDLWVLDSSTSPKTSLVPFHTDNPFLAEPEGVVSFWSLRSSPDGGENIMLPLDRIVGHLNATPRSAGLYAELLDTPVLFEHQDNQTVGQIIDEDSNTVRFDAKYLDLAHRVLGERFLQMLDGIQDAADPVKLEAGDVLFFKNRSLLHARLPYDDPQRLSIRARIAAEV